jgi:hypothetical protein
VGRMAPSKTAGKPAAPTLVVVQMTVRLPKEDLVAAWAPDAPEIAKVPGMRWKFWSFDPASRAYAGVYLFESGTAAQEFLAGPVMDALRGDPNVEDVRAQHYEVLPSLSQVTRAPLEAAPAARP